MNRSVVAAFVLASSMYPCLAQSTRIPNPTKVGTPVFRTAQEALAWAEGQLTRADAKGAGTFEDLLPILAAYMKASSLPGASDSVRVETTIKKAEIFLRLSAPENALDTMGSLPLDIANASGTPLRAPADGVVAFVGWNPYDSSDPSFMLVMGHAGGLESRFMHLQSRYVVRAGQSVKKGQLIGYMGNTGNSTGAHLHWEIYRGNTPINPRSLV